MHKNRLVMPVVKWVGGKRQLLSALSPLFPEDIATSTYCEPFLGGGAVLFFVQPERAVVNDLNEDLMTVYRVIRDDVETLLKELKKHKNTSEYFYKIRDLDRDKKRYQRLSPVKKASRLLYLNKTCYNGLFRVNASSEFNTPFGRYKNPNIVNEETLRAVHAYFQRADITFLSQDYATVLGDLPEHSFVYLDPPYDPLTDTASFTGYNKGGFDRGEQLRLKECCDDLTARGIRFLLSNSATDYIRELYSGYTLTTVDAKRAVNSVGSKRGAVQEVLVRNYGPK